MTKWIVRAATMAALVAAGILIGTWDESKGYPIVDPHLPVDTLWFSDSADLAEYAADDSVRRAVIKQWIADNQADFKWYATTHGGFKTCEDFGIAGDSLYLDGKWFADWDAMETYAKRAAKFAGIDTLKCWISVKIGDLPQCKNGQIIGAWTPWENFIKTGNMTNPEYEFSGTHKKVYAVLMGKRNWQGNAIRAMQDTGDTKEWSEELQDSAWVKNANYYTHRARILPKQIAQLLGNDSILALWRSSQTVPIVDISDLPPESLMCAVYGVEFDSVPDSNSIASGYHTVGSGGDYNNLLAAENDLATLTGNCSLYYVSSVAETATVAFNIDYNGHWLVVGSETPHSGDPTAGHTMSFGGGADGITIDGEGDAGAGGVILQDFQIKRTTGGSGARFHVNATDDGTGADTFSVIIQRMIFDGQDLAGGGVRASGSNWTAFDIVNCKFVDIGDDHAIFNNGPEATWTIENCYISSSDTAIDLNNSHGSIVNTLCEGNEFCFTGLDSATGTNNASDGTGPADGNWKVGSGNQTNITVTNELISTDEGNSLFGKVKKYGVCWNGGTTPTLAYNTTGAAGNTRPGAFGTSIGADQYAYGHPVSIKIDTASTGGTYAPAIPMFNMAHEWNMNKDTITIDSIADSTGAYNMKLQNAAVITDAIGKYGGALSLDGGTAHAIRTAGGAAFSEKSAFAFSFWMKQNVLSATDYIMTVNKDGGNYIAIYSSGGNFYFDTSVGASQAWTRFAVATYLNANQWHHLVIVYDESAGTKAQWYVDGVAVQQTTSGTYNLSSLDVSATDFTLGHPTNNSLDGALDNVKIVAFSWSQSDVGREYAATIERPSLALCSTKTQTVQVDTATNDLTIESILFYNGADSLTLSDSLTMNLNTIIDSNVWDTVNYEITYNGAVTSYGQFQIYSDLQQTTAEKNGVESRVWMLPFLKPEQTVWEF